MAEGLTSPLIDSLREDENGMVSGLVQDELGEQLTIRQLPVNKSLSSISIPTAYQYYYPGGEGTGVYLPPGPKFTQSSSTSTGNRGTLPQTTRNSRAIGPGYYQRTLSSSSLLTNRSSTANSRGDYNSIGRGLSSQFTGGTGEYSGKFESRDAYHDRISGSSSNIIYIDNSEAQSFNNHGGGREYRDRRLIRESSQPIIINVPITAPKATATTISRATSPPPPPSQFSIKVPSPRNILEKRGQSSKERNESGLQKKFENPTEESSATDTDCQDMDDPGRALQIQHIKIEVDRNEERNILPSHKSKSIPSNLVKYCRNAPLTKVKHPLEENIFSSLFITLLAVGVALVIGIPVLFFTGALLIVAIFVRYSLSLLHGCYSYSRFICSNRQVLSSRTSTPPQIFPCNRLAFANDVRWLGPKKPKQCQSVLHTLLVFEGAMDLSGLRHFVQSRVLHAETPEGELAYPRLLQKVIPLLAGYRWELDVTFDIQNHIFSGPTHIRNETQIQEYLGLLLTESLPLEKPLWEIRVITNYGVQKDTLAILRVHQCLADGMTLVRILCHSLSDQAQMHIPQRPHFAGLSFGFNVIRSLIVGPLTFFLWLLTTFRDCNLFSIPLVRKRKHLFSKKLRNKGYSSSDSESNSNPVKGKKSFPATSSDSPTLSSRPNDQLTQEVSVTKSPHLLAKKHPRKHVNRKKANKRKRDESLKRKRRPSMWNVAWSAPVSVPKVARVKQIMRSSLNDVLLSAAAGSIRSYLQKQGIPCPDDVKVVIPVDLRNDLTSQKSSTKLGCKVASVLTTIPSGMEAAIPRLWATRHRLDELKASADPIVAYGATSVLMNLLPHRVGVCVFDNITDKASLQFCNLPGPTSTVVVGGIPLKSIYPIYPPSGKIRVAISAFTYADQVHLTVVAHRSLSNAGASLLRGISCQVDQLSRQLSQRRVPGESRRSTRNSSLNNPEITKPPTRQIHMQLQVVQEELQELSHRLDVRTQDLSLSHGLSPPGISSVVHDDDFRSSDESLGGGAGASLSPVGQAQLRTRLKTLKNEFSELIGELRRRSSIVEGVAMSFEDEEMEEEFRKPRKRALSVVSMTRRNSLFASRSMTTPDSSVCYSSDDDLPSSPSHDIRVYNPSSNIRQSSSPIRTTAV